MGEAADLAVGLGGLFEIQVGVGVGLDAVGLEAEVLQQVVADQVRHLAELVAEAEIDVGLAEVDRQQLGVAVGDVQQADVAEPGQVVQLGGALLGQRQFAVQAHAAGSGDGHDLEEFAAIHAHGGSFEMLFRPGRKKTRRVAPAGLTTQIQSLLTGDSGSTRKATMWVICSGVSQLCRPKRGMLVQAVKALEL